MRIFREKDNVSSEVVFLVAKILQKIQKSYENITKVSQKSYKNVTKILQKYVKFSNITEGVTDAYSVTTLNCNRNTLEQKVERAGFPRIIFHKFTPVG